MNHGSPPDPKKFRLHPGDPVGFSDAGERVLVEWPTLSKPADFREAVEDELLAAGFSFAQADRAASALDGFLTKEATARAGDAVRTILGRLPGGRRGAELKAALLGAVDGDGAEMAAQFGTSKQSWHQRVDRLRASIFKKR